MTEAAHQIDEQPAARRERAQAGLGRPAAGPEVAVLDERAACSRRRRRRGRRSAAPTSRRLRRQPGSQRGRVRGRLVPHRATRAPRRRRLPAHAAGRRRSSTAAARRSRPARSTRRCSSIRTSREAVAFAMPHATLGEDVGAAVVLRQAHGPDELARSSSASAWPTSRCRARSSSWTNSRRARPASCSASGLAERLGLGPADGPAARPRSRHPARGCARRRLVALLGVDGVPVDDDFFALGGDSLRGARLLAHVASVTGVDLPVSALFEEGSTVGSMARLVDERRERGPVPAPARPEPGTGEGVLRSSRSASGSSTGWTRASRPTTCRSCCGCAARWTRRHFGRRSSC